MARRAALLALLMLATPVPGAAAGSASDPDFIDGPDPRVRASLDLRAAWLEVESGGIRFTVQVQEARTLPRNEMWGVVFATEESGFWFAGVVVDSTGRLRTTLQLTGFTAAPETFRSELKEPAFETGSPARISALIPWNAVPGLRRGDVVTFTDVFSDVYSRGWTDVDVARGRVTLGTSEEATAPRPFHERHALPLVLAFAVVGAGVAGGLAWFLHRRKAARAGPPE